MNPLTSYAEFRERSNWIYDDSSPKTNTLATAPKSKNNLQKVDEHPYHNILLGREKVVGNKHTRIDMVNDLITCRDRKDLFLPISIHSDNATK